MEIKASLKTSFGQHSQGVGGVERSQDLRGPGKPDLSGIPVISAEQLQGCLRRSHKARAVHEDILSRVADGKSHLSKGDIEGMLHRAGVETTEVKTVLAYHVHEHPHCFDHSALEFLATLDFSDVGGSEYVDELKRQNAESVKDHREFIQTDRQEFKTEQRDLQRSDRREVTQKLSKTADKKSELRSKTALEMEAEFAAETTQSGLNPKEAFMLLAHRKRFANND